MSKLKLLTEIISEKHGVDLKPQDDLFIIGGLDSLDFAELVAELDSSHKLKIDPVKLITDWESLRTLEGLSASLIQLEQ